jgi:hypothetical protein
VSSRLTPRLCSDKCVGYCLSACVWRLIRGLGSNFSSSRGSLNAGTVFDFSVPSSWRGRMKHRKCPGSKHVLQYCVCTLEITRWSPCIATNASRWYLNICAYIKSANALPTTQCSSSSSSYDNNNIHMKRACREVDQWRKSRELLELAVLAELSPLGPVSGAVNVDAAMAIPWPLCCNVQHLVAIP